MTRTRPASTIVPTLGVLVLAMVVGAPSRGDEPGAGTVTISPEPRPETTRRPKPQPGKLLEEPPVYGVYYDRREPSFYTGFAPRSQDPDRIHLQIGRGNQLRITVVLSDEAIEGYASDLLLRYQTYRSLVDRKRIQLTQNTAFEDFEETIEESDLEDLVEDEEDLSEAELRRRNLELMERLNPGRVFRIRMPVDELVRRWAVQVRPEDRASMSRDRQLELVNQMLPTRLWVADVDPRLTRELRALVVAALDSPEAAAVETLRPDFLALLERVSQGHYPERDGQLDFTEFTAIHPIGTFNDYTDYRGKKIPLYPTPGRRALTTHQRTKTVDHIPTKWAYSYFPWIPYMHVGKTMHNSFHTLWWAMPVTAPEFLPAEWREVSRGSRDGKDFEHIFLLSRGPMSSGCTHINAGHISELRQVMPSDTQKLYEIDVFLNRSYDYDVFDIDGDFEPEVMGVRYYIAYSLRNKKPNRLRARNERHAFYEWLYAGSDIRFDDEDRVWFPEVQDGHFVERTARKGRSYRDIRLYEAAYEHERVQFYAPRPIEFVRNLRKLSLEHPVDGVTPQVAARSGADEKGGGSR
jgi:hypothetical protein